MLRLRVAIVASIIALSILLWFVLARHMPLRHFTWFCLMTGAFITIELLVAKHVRGRMERSRALSIALELALGSVFVALFYWFAVYIYPATK